MGLPDFFFGTYRRYKTDTDAIVKWLAKQATAHGYSSQSTSQEDPSTQTTSKKKKKGKAKSSPPNEKQTFTTHELVKLADWIANRRPPITVPSWVVNFLRSVIAGRKRCANWFQTNATSEKVKNQTHSHFIQILEDVLTKLIPKSTPDSKTKPVQSDVDAVTNSFDILSVEDSEVDISPPVDEFLPATVLQKREPTYKLEMEEQDNSEEVYFALFCFFEDLNNLREFISNLWRDYQQGKVDLVTASLTTNMAFDLVRRAETDLISLMPAFKSYREISLVPYILMCHLRGEEFDPDNPPTDELVPEGMRDVADFLFVNVYSLLDGFCDIIQAGHAPIYKPGHYGTYDPSVDRSTLSNYGRWQEDKIILAEAMTDFFVASQFGKKSVPVLDELTDGLMQVFETKKIPLWVVYAAQTFLDINHTLRQDVTRALDDLHSAGDRAYVSLDKYFSAPGPRTFMNWPPHNEHGMQMIKVYIDEWIKGDALGLVRRKWLENSSIDEPPTPFALLRRHPVFCGLLQFKLYTLLKDAGIALATAWGSIIYVAHLYNACRQGDYLRGEWPDMELFMDIHTREAIFAGRVPKRPEDWLKSTMLMLGAAPNTVASIGRRMPRSGRIEHARHGPRGFNSASPVSDVFSKDYFSNGNVTLSYETVQNLVETWLQKSGVVIKRQHNEEASFLQTQWKKSHKMTPIQFLSVLRYAITLEEVMLRFDYMDFHLQCLDLLRRLRTALDSDLRKYNGDGYIENDTQLAFIVRYLFVAVTAGATISSQIGNVPVRSKMMVKATDVLGDFIEQEGGVETAKLVKICALPWNS
jgi:hypothetical protein